MKWQLSRSLQKMLFIAAAVLIAAASLMVSHRLVSDLQNEERAKMEVWAEAMRALMSADEHTDLNLVLTVINGNNTIPVIVVDEAGRVTSHRNLPPFSKVAADSLIQLQQELADLREDGHQMQLLLPPSSLDGRGEHLQLYYGESLMIRRLAGFPYVQLLVVALFAFVALFALLASKRAEQNKVWVGLTKETAHQLGTPISSLMAWMAVLRESYPDDALLPEMSEDVRRLERVAERFSKIGSVPVLKPASLSDVFESILPYLRRRASQRVQLSWHCPRTLPQIPLSPPLFEWVIEVICKNAIDAMQGEGHIDIRCEVKGGFLLIDLEDSGKGIARKHFKSVFRPGFTTKARGWGLGLSLAKRIVEEYHHGRIFVLRSTLGVGTCFRIELPLR